MLHVRPARQRRPSLRHPSTARFGILPGVLFFFEAGFFILAIAALALAELWGRGQALGLWAALTALSLLAGPILRARLQGAGPTDAAEARWRGALEDSWWHLNKLLVLGLVALAGWWWLGRALTT